jgi:glycosyl transferase family 25
MWHNGSHSIPSRLDKIELMNIAPAIFVINLDYRTDRRNQMLRQLSRVGWRAEFFSAIRPDSAGGFPSIGARGCFLSHLAVLKEAQNAEAQQVVILEDDVNFAAQFPERWKYSMSILETQEWSIFYAGHVMKDLPPGLSRISPSVAVQNCQFVVINRSAISKLVSQLESILSRRPGHPLGGPMHVDGAFSTIRRQNPLLVTFAHFPALGYQRPSRTDIGNVRWFDRAASLTPIVSFARKLKGVLRL